MTEVYRALRLNEREECLNLWLTVWPGNDSRAYFERYFYGDVEWLPYYTQVAVCDDRLVSAVQICKRTVACGDFTLTMGGIANVATLPQYRGRGYNAGCLKNAIEVMEADAMDFSLLFTGINSYYRKFGFVDLPRVRTSARIKPDFQYSQSLSRQTAYAVRPAVSGDMAAIQRLYENYNRDRPIAVRRSEAYWRDWMRFDTNNPPADLLVACAASGTVAGYLYSGVFNSAVPYDANSAAARIIELCVNTSSEDEEDVTHCLLNEVIAGLPYSVNRKLVMEIAITPAVRRALVDAAGLDAIEESVIDSGMVRLLHRDNLLRSICMCSNERWRYSGSPPGKLAFETPYGLALLDASGGFPRMAASNADGFNMAAPISQTNLIYLLFGAATPHHSTINTGLPHSSAGLLAALFPRRDMVYWGADGF